MRLDLDSGAICRRTTVDTRTCHTANSEMSLKTSLFGRRGTTAQC